MALQASEKAVEGQGRVGPPLSTYSLCSEAYAASDDLGINLYPWQAHALDVMMSCTEDEQFLYREVAIIAARQNGKSKILLPRITWSLEHGRRIIHTAQNRLLPRKVFMELARYYEREPEAYIRKANGQEEITLPNGGSYMIVAPQRGARGLSADDLIIDELREMEDFDFIAAAEPTLTESLNPQVIYLSNAGTDQSVVLNDLRERAAEDSNLAYMEWSAAPERAVEDQDGWREANPILNHGQLTLPRLQALYEKYWAAGELAIFETEHLCRWVKSMLPQLVSGVYWHQAHGQVEWKPTRPVMGISVDPDGKRASAVMAWKQSDGRVALTIIGDVDADPVDQTAFGVALQEKQSEFGISEVAYDPWTDQHLSKHFLGARAVQGAEFANASERFVRAVETGGLVHQWAERLSEELPHASRKNSSQSAWMAHRAGTRSITTVLAAVRAVWLASEPRAVVGDIF
jgi:hypothetical protein